MDKIYGACKYATSDSLCKNSLYLMISSNILTIFGFFFWIINAKLYTTTQVGTATVVISAISLIANFSFLGLGGALVKYLPTSKSKNEKINTVFTLCASSAFIFSSIYLINIKVISSEISFIKNNQALLWVFITSSIFTTLNLLSDNIFIAYRNSKYILFKNIIYGILAIFFTFTFIYLGSSGIFIAVGVANLIAFLYSVTILIFKYNFFLKPKIYTIILKRISKFALTVYLAGIIGGLPALVLPLIISNSLGVNSTAYYFISMMIANMLYIIPSAVAQSLFAEGCYGDDDIKKHVKKSIKFIGVLLIPAILITILLGNKILYAFGEDYSANGTIFLQMMAIASIPITINCIGSTLFLITHKSKKIIYLNILCSSVILVLSVFIPIHSLIGIGIAWFLGQFITSLFYLRIIKNHL